MVDKDQDVILLRGRLDGRQRTRLVRLLDMMYMPSEIAEEIGFNVRQVYRVYIPVGCPHERDQRNHIWINGKAFREWAQEVYKKRDLAENETFCLTCKRAVNVVNPSTEQEGQIKYILSDCPNCGRKLAKIIENNKRAV